MSGISLTVTDLGSSAAFLRDFNRLAFQARNRAGMMRVVGRRGANELKTHFRIRNRTPNKLGGERTNWWQRVADSVQNPTLIGDTGVKITINHLGFALKVFGGTITPKTKASLTIPQAPEAHGRTVATFQQETGIQLFLLRKKGGALSNLLAGFVGDGTIKVFYILAKSVTQQPDPEALPDQGRFEAALVDEGQQYLDREIRRNRL